MRITREPVYQTGIEEADWVEESEEAPEVIAEDQPEEEIGAELPLIEEEQV